MSGSWPFGGLLSAAGGFSKRGAPRTLKACRDAKRPEIPTQDAGQ